MFITSVAVVILPLIPGCNTNPRTQTEAQKQKKLTQTEFL